MWMQNWRPRGNWGSPHEVTPSSAGRYDGEDEIAIRVICHRPSPRSSGTCLSISFGVSSISFSSGNIQMWNR